jgi:hypothetical protein
VRSLPLGLVVSVFVAALLAMAAPVLAQEAAPTGIARAGELYLGADFEGAQREARRVLAAGTSTREDVVGALRLLVALETMLGQPTRAAESARLLVALDPTAEPAAGAPDEATQAVVAARARPRPSVTVEIGTGVAIATATDSPESGAALWLECDDAAGARAQSGPTTAPLRLPVDTAHDVRCRAQLRTLGGMPFAETTDDHRPAGGIGGSGSRDDSTLWIVVGIGGGVVLTALIVGIAVAASSGPSDATFGAPVVIGF